MLVLNIEVSGLEVFNTDAYKEAMASGIRRMSEETQNFWTTIAGQRLKSSRSKYQKGIGLEGITRESFTIHLEGTLPVSVELGTPPYYMTVPIGKRVPMNENREINFNNPTVWKTGTGSPWLHPGFEGFNMLDDVQEELISQIAPKHIDEALSKIK